MGRAPRTDRYTGWTIPGPGRMRSVVGTPVRTLQQLDKEARELAMRHLPPEEEQVEKPRNDDMGRLALEAAREAGQYVKSFDAMRPDTQRLVGRAAMHISPGRSFDQLVGDFTADPVEQLVLDFDDMPHRQPSITEAQATAHRYRHDHFFRAGRHQR